MTLFAIVITISLRQIYPYRKSMTSTLGKSLTLKRKKLSFLGVMFCNDVILIVLQFELFVRRRTLCGVYVPLLMVTYASLMAARFLLLVRWIS